ncbi:MAG: cohesin domain-containing protein, partial [Clostridium sp.]|nr:cohesin domain-containing protein [Clostridium sp.]
MKRFLAMLVAVLMALSLVTIPVTAEKDPEPEAVFTAGSATAEPGESFDLSIDVSGEYEAHTLNMQVNYDQDALTIDSIDWGTVLTSVQGAMVIVDSTTIPGSVRIGMICPSAGATAQGQIVNIHFTVADDAEAGEYPVELVIVNFDYLPAGETIADPYETAVQNGVVTVPNDEPIPATDLDEALNVAGGTLHFEPVGSYTFEVEEDHA